jgi:hypothetical protein
VFTHGEPADSTASLRGSGHRPMGARREYGDETLVMDDESQKDLERYICQRVEDKWIELHARRTARPQNQEVDGDF